MTDFETGAVNTETPEVTEPEEGAVEETEELETEVEETEELETEVEETETPEVTEPEEPELPEGKKSADAAFAEMRRRNAELESELEEFRQAQEEQDMLDRQREIETLAEELGIDVEELQSAVEEQERIEAIEAENQQLRAREVDRDVEQMMKDDLAEIQAIDPSIKSFDDLPGYNTYVQGGVRGAKAYFAIMAENELTKPKPAKAPGQVNRTPHESEYYTSEEIDQMTEEEIKANYPKVLRSMERI